MTMFLAPTVPAGVVMATVVDVMVPRVALAPPTVTLVVPVRFVPVITVEVPPKVDPVFVDIEEYVGIGVT